jgi:hypothetical protein
MPRYDGWHPDDEDLSGLLDGIGDERVSDHLASCPACAERSAALRGVSRRLGASAGAAPPPDPERRRMAVAAALAATDGPTGKDAEIVRPARFLRTLAALGSAAAVVVAAVIGLHLASHSQTSEKSSSATTAPAASGTSGAASGAQSATTAASGSSAAGGTGGKASSPTTLVSGGAIGKPPALAVLGPAGDGAQLVSELEAALGSGATIPSTVPGSHIQAVAVCPLPAAPAGTGGLPVLETRLDYRGVDTVVFVYAVASGHLAVLEPASTCVGATTLRF